MSDVVVVDERNARRGDAGWAWRWTGAARCTAATLIAERLRTEADKVGGGKAPSELFAELGGRDEVIVERLIAAALAAFDRGRLLLIVNDRQVVSLDHEIDLTGPIEAVFVRLQPLKAG